LGLLAVRSSQFIRFGASLTVLSTFQEAFAATGWRVGWLIGPESIIKPTLAASTRIVFCTNSPLQEATAAGLEEAKERQFFEKQLAEYVERRKVLTDAFDKLKMKYTLPEGSYFVLLVSVCQ
jgi:kynurenine aminotransferase